MNNTITPKQAAEAVAITGAARFWIGDSATGRMIFDREPNPADHPGMAIAEYRCAEVDAALPAAAPAPESEPADVLKARAEGRAEALYLLMSISAEGGMDDFVSYTSNGEAGDHSGDWDVAKLREFFHVDDAAYSLIDKCEASFWEYEAARIEIEWEAQQRRAAPVPAAAQEGGEVRK